jgi:hypothetical protein
MARTKNKDIDDSNAFVKEIYPVISTALEKHQKGFLANMAKFFNDRHEEIFAIAPYENVLFNATDVNRLFQSIEVNERDINELMRGCYFMDIAAFNPRFVKEPYISVLGMSIRYFLKQNDQRNAELVSIYTAFSGKIYASLYYKYFHKLPPSKYKTIMDYVINNMLTDKFDLKRTGTVFGAIQSIVKTWIEKYNAELVSNNSSDSDFVYVFQQLHDRVNSFLKKISVPYHEAYTNKNYMNYETDSLDPDEFHITDNDAALAARITENAMGYLTSQSVSIDFCNKSKDPSGLVKATEVKDIMEGILGDKDNLPKLRRVINIVICDFMANFPGKRVGSVDFIAETIKMKPNTKSPLTIEVKATLLSWLDENSPNYRRRKNRDATANAYYKSILMYITLVIAKVASR